MRGWGWNAVVALLSLATACGSGSNGDEPSAEDNEQTTTIVAPTTTTANPDAPVEAAYRAATTAYFEALHALDVELPAFRAVAIGEFLDETRRHIAGLRRQGLTVRGASELSEVVIVSNDGANALVRAKGCDRSSAYDAQTGELRDSPDALRFEEDAVLVFEGGWKVTKKTGKYGEKCAA